MQVSYKTEQENFWAGEFGDEYIGRNRIEDLVAAKRYIFSSILSRTRGVASVAELGANIGVNLLAIHSVLPQAKLHAVEINDKAVQVLKSHGILETIQHGSLLEHKAPVCDLSYTAGVLIHINPDSLPQAYAALYEASRRYVMVFEYYNPSPVSIPYRGHQDRLFKRDFAGEIMEAYPDLSLVDYGFCYRRDPNFPMDDMTWFLMEKRG